VLRCGWCGAASGATADPAFGELEGFLQEKGIRVDACWVAALCAHSILYQRLRQFRKKIRKSDAIGVCSCSMGVKTLYWVTDGTKRVVPFCDTFGAGGRDVDWEHMGGPETCVPSIRGETIRCRRPGGTPVSAAQPARGGGQVQKDGKNPGHGIRQDLGPLRLVDEPVRALIPKLPGRHSIESDVRRPSR
jgi:hypothetical protein